jgi:hypothetical protein
MAFLDDFHLCSNILLVSDRRMLGLLDFRSRMEVTRNHLKNRSSW